MNELDRFWSEKLALAIENARAAGRSDISDYLALKAGNDLLRQAGVEWLFGSFAEAALEESMRRPAIIVEREEPHNFPYRGANVVGSRLFIKLGVRCLTVEAGWTRTPADGFMRGGALAAGRVSHFGMPAENASLVLSAIEGVPVWRRLSGEESSGEFGLDDVLRHFSVFIG